MENIVLQQITALAETLAAGGYDWIVTSSRRAPRLFDQFLEDDELKSGLLQKFLYHGPYTCKTDLLRDARIAIVDDCVQRGLNLRSMVEAFSGIPRLLDVYAFAACSWHSQHRQYFGPRIRQPLLECDSKEFEELTSYLNLAFWSHPLPLDCDDPVFVAHRQEHASDDALVSAIGRLGPFGVSPVADGGDVRRCATHFSPGSPLVADICRSSGPLLKDPETKICWTISHDGPVYMVPICLYRLESTSGPLPEPMASCSRPFEQLLGVCRDPLRARFDAIHLAAQAVISGRVLRVLRDWAHIDLAPWCEQFSRQYGRELGGSVLACFNRLVRESADGFSPERLVGGQKGSDFAIAPEQYQSVALCIRQALRQEYRQRNAGKLRQDFTRAGLEFSRIASMAREVVTDFSDQQTSLLLDIELATSWAKPADADVESSTSPGSRVMVTEYVATEQDSGSQQASNDDVSFARPKDWARLHNSQYLIQSTVLLLEGVLRTLDKSGQVRFGYFEHAAAALFKLLHNRQRSMTILAVGNGPHGDVLRCGSSIYTPKPGPVETYQDVLGIKISRDTGGQRFISLVVPPSARSAGESFCNEVAAHVGELRSILMELIRVPGLSLGKLLVFLSTCTELDVGFDAIYEDLSRCRAVILKIGRGGALSDISKIGHDLAGARDKVAILASRSPDYRSLLFSHKLDVVPSAAFTELQSQADPRPLFWLPIMWELGEELAGLGQAVDATEPGPQLFEHGQHSDVQVPQEITRRTCRELAVTIEQSAVIRDNKWVLPGAIRSDRCGPGVLERPCFVSIDAARGGKTETEERKRERQEVHWPILRSFCAIFHGRDARDPDGDRLFLVFDDVAMGMRFTAATCWAFWGARLFGAAYRVVVTLGGKAEFHADGNITSFCLDMLGEVEDHIRKKEQAVGGRDGSLGVSVDFLADPWHKKILHLIPEAVPGTVTTEPVKLKGTRNGHSEIGCWAFVPASHE